MLLDYDKNFALQNFETENIGITYLSSIASLVLIALCLARNQIGKIKKLELLW